MNIAFFGATSQIAKGLITKFNEHSQNKLSFFVRNCDSFNSWRENQNISCLHEEAKLYSEFSDTNKIDVIINCIGIGDPAKAASISSSIQITTNYFDEIILKYLTCHPETKYFFFSSGIAYGDIFSAPAKNYYQQNIDLNSNKPEDAYAISKINAENIHRSLTHLSIIDIRVFSYLSDEIDINSKFFIGDAIRAIKHKEILCTNKTNITRDYVGADDLYQLITKLIPVKNLNAVFDAYSKEPIDKMAVLDLLSKNFNLKYKFLDTFKALNATGNKENYYSVNFKAKNFGYSPKLSSKDVIKKVTRKLVGY
jgi:nucleoside-diphosphate-sugar epimerase